MAGGLLQLAAKGQENQYLNGNPSIYFFKDVYMRHSNFVMNSISVNSNYSENLSNNDITTIKIRVPRNGDLINNIFLKLNIPNIYSEYKEEGGFKFIERLGSTIIKSVKFLIEDTVIEELTGEFIHMFQNLYNKSNKVDIINSLSGDDRKLYHPVGNIDNTYRGYNSDITSTGNFLNKNYNNLPTIKGQNLYIPLPFWFTRNNGQAFPLLALSYHNVYIELKLRPIKELFLLLKKEDIVLESPIDENGNNITINDGNLISRLYYQKPSDNQDINNFLNSSEWVLDCKLDINYIFLDNQERNILVKEDNKYLIEQVKNITAFEITGRKNIELDIYHPVKEIFVVPRRNDVALRNQWTNFTNLDYTEQNYKDYQTYYLELSFNDALNNINGINNPIQQLGKFRKNSQGVITDIKYGDKYIEGEKLYTNDDIERLLKIWEMRPSINIPSINRQNYKYFNENIIEHLSINFNNQERQEQKSHKFYDKKQYFIHHNNYNVNGVSIYSFSLEPEIFQPTGMCNFSSLNNVAFDIKLKEPSVYDSLSYKYDIMFFFINYNILHINHGEGSLVYGNN